MDSAPGLTDFKKSGLFRVNCMRVKKVEYFLFLRFVFSLEKERSIVRCRKLKIYFFHEKKEFVK